MKTISFRGKDLFFKSTHWPSVIAHWLFAKGAAGGVGYRSLLIG